MTETLLIPLERLDPDPDNIRDDDSDVDELTQSIKALGLLQPLIVYAAGERWRIAAGHRRRRALLQLGAGHAPCVLREAPRSDLERVDIMLAENAQRRPLNPMEEARAYRRYVEAGFNQTQIAERCSRAQSHVSTLLMFLTELTEEEQTKLERGALSVNAARGLMVARRAGEGRARSDHGRHHSMKAGSANGHSVPHFAKSHPLHEVAVAACVNAMHADMLKLNGACGQCWEDAIRRDQDVEMALREPEVEPRQDAASTLRCKRCSKDGSHRHSACRFTRGDGTTVNYPRHDYAYVPRAQAVPS